jgi:N-acetylglutamate synthase-like GNAT family acetyltransferase
LTKTQTIEQRRDNLVLSDDRELVDLDVVHNFLRQSYWSEGVPIDVVRRSVENSLCFGVYDNDNQVAFARVVSDFSTFAYIADVFVLEGYRGRGISKWIMAAIMHHPSLQGLRRWMLLTQDAHRLYRQFGFDSVSSPERIMEITAPNIYRDAGN